MNPSLFAVITTIQPPTDCVRRLGEVLGPLHTPLLIIGDSKGPFEYDLQGSELLTLSDQSRLSFELAALLPVKHYARKNLGYLVALSRGAGCIYETDDDNAPLASWQVRSLETEAVSLRQAPWINVYRWFSESLIWPRGLPLEAIRDHTSLPAASGEATGTVTAPIQQGLANNSPDVDAIWRLVLDADFSFNEKPSVVLPPSSWCPFNSQTTWWWNPAFPLLYLPSFCSFRMTDIWRSFVAQRCLWELEKGLVFHAPEVYQERNVHSLFRDFEAEVPGYLGNAKLVATLESLTLHPGAGNVSNNLVRCYEALVNASFFPSEELNLVKAWINDIERIG